MKLNTAAGIALFFIGSFALLYTTINIPSVEFYTGGIVIGLYIFGLFYAFSNAIRQANKIARSESNNKSPTLEKTDKAISQQKL